MKWPKLLTLVRHDTSAYNALIKQKQNSVVFQDFIAAFKDDKTSQQTVALAKQVQEMFSLGVGDADTPLADTEGRQAYETGVALSKGQTPNIIFVSPYARTWCTLEHITRGWPALKKVRIVEDERIREQEHGLALLYNDWRVFHTLHPEQAALYELEGPYWYRYPQGENKPDVRQRIRSWFDALVRDYVEQNVFVVTHHLTILAIRANLERLTAKQFIHLDQCDKPINCGVTTYAGDQTKGRNGKLVLQSYNAKLYT